MHQIIKRSSYICGVDVLHKLVNPKRSPRKAHFQPCESGWRIQKSVIKNTQSNQPKVFFTAPIWFSNKLAILLTLDIYEWASASFHTQVCRIYSSAFQSIKILLTHKELKSNMYATYRGLISPELCIGDAPSPPKINDNATRSGT